MSLKIGNKNKLVYDWSLSVFGLVVLCSCLLWCCVLVSVSTGKWIRQIDLQIDPANRFANRFAKSICKMDPANRFAK